MRILTTWLRDLLPGLAAIDDARLADDLTLRGIAVEAIETLPDGSLFEMDITTNRVDAMNHYGVAREAATIYGLTLPPLQFPLPSPLPSPLPGSPIPVAIQAPDACGRFTAQVVRSATATGSGPLTAAMQRYFQLLGQKSIAHAVDATNLAWLMMGHPTHAFDLDAIEGGIVVRRARAGEQLRTLDGIDRTLDPDDLIVADHVKPLALAGVMGGWQTMIRPETRNILVEAAWFDPVAVRRTARRHGLHTDASHRFERGADFAAAPTASALVTALLVEAGGQPEGERVDLCIDTVRARTGQRTPIRLALGEVHRILGSTLDGTSLDGSTLDASPSKDTSSAAAGRQPCGIGSAQVEATLRGLGCDLQPDAALQPESAHPESAQPEASWSVTLPSWRLDLEREIDLIEEIARVHGYNRFANTLPPFTGSVQPLPHAAAESLLRFHLRAAGLHEAIGSTFCSAAEAALTEPQPGTSVPLGNPLSAEAGLLRPSLIPSMLTMLGGNLHRDLADVRLFEIGTVFSGSTERVTERPALAIGLAGSVPDDGLAQPRPLDFFHLKGILEQIAACFATQSVVFDAFPPEAALTPAWLHPWRAARLSLNGMTIGWFGELHPREAAQRKLRTRVLLAELALDRLLSLPLRRPALRELSPFQPVRRDFSLLPPASVSWARLADSLATLAIPEILDWRLRELLPSGPGIPADHQAMLVGVTFQAADRTLRDDELQTYTAAILQAAATLGGRLRS